MKSLLYFSAICEIGLGNFENGIAKIEQALDHISPSGENFLKDKASFLNYRGDAELNLTRLAVAQQTFETAEATARESGDPEVLAEVLEYFGKLYVAKDLAKAAEAKFREALSIRENLLEENHPQRTSLEWKILRGLAPHYHAYASRQADRLLSRGVRVSGEDVPARALHHHNWAQTKQRAHAFDEARDGYREAIRLSEGHLGPRNPFLFSFINNYADMELKLGNLEVAETMYRDLLERARQSDSDGLFVGASMHQLGVILMDQGRLDESEALLKDSLTILESKFGPNQEKAITVLNNLGFMERRRKDYGEAARWLEEAARRGRLAPERPASMTTALRNLAEVYSDAKDFEASGRVHAEIVRDEGLLTVAGLESLTWQARCYLETERWQEALDTATLAVEKWEPWEYDSKNKDWRIVSRRFRAHALVELGRYQEALEILHEVLEYRQHLGGTEERLAKIHELMERAEAGMAADNTSDDTAGAVSSDGVSN